MSKSYVNYTAPSTWTDIFSVSTYSDLAGKSILVQAVGLSGIKLFAGGTSAPIDANQGYSLTEGASWSGSADHLWVRGGEYATLAIGLED